MNILAKGIDVSKHQGNIDWTKVKKAGIQFAMIRVGYRGYSGGNITLDPYFEKNITGALANGLKVGIYFFSTAISTKEAAEEANWTLQHIAKYNVTYPVVFDYEGFDDKKYRSYGTTRAQRTAFNKAFIDVIKGAGFNTMIYGSKGNIRTTYDLDALNEPLWCARYAGGYTKILDSDTYFPAIDGEDIAMWQYTSIGRVDGINGNVDMNYMYIDLSVKKEYHEPNIEEVKPIYSLPTIKNGSRGTAVKVWQAIIGVTVDGIFGANTEQATKRWQNSKGLAADGIVGKNTWNAGLESL